MNLKISYLLFLLFFAACGPSRNLVYLDDLPEDYDYTTDISNEVELTIQSDDLLRITVNSMNPESNALFNSGSLSTNTTGNTNAIYEGYIVDKDGFVNFPVLGMIHLAGLTKEEAIEKITAGIKNYVKDPIVNIRFLNFKITVIGEVNRPSTFTIPTGRINILEAIGLAGDMTAYGKRENILIIREKGGKRTTTKVNLNDKEILSSPYFYLQQNDIVYVEPDNKAKLAQVNNNYRYIPIFTAVISVIAIVLSNLYN